MNNFIIDSQIHLTNREIEILIMLVTRAPSNKQIARTLKISESMIKKHMSNLLKKYNVQTRSQLIIFAKTP
jgi:DNA-binding NarL/FixJ family response regulator